eukprot:CAMPEP_0194450808 /NCGR_PEP_ID=MMETSP0176-20130528/130941_1 /TAXON_ID=216777 /ORGANISM="Proboscia alata, Strain PI-D3" /LENGTH=135 /DNA_ID=CAMNT_0039278151 /DNA_START=585 /DNA_END=992 /DNA_ORIENTATION=-
MKSLRAMAESTKTNAERLGVKIKPYLDFIPMSNFVIPVLHSQINLGNDVLYSLLDYAADNIESISSEEQVTRNSYLTIDNSIAQFVTKRNDWDISNEGRQFNFFENSRRNVLTSISDDPTEQQLQRENRIHELEK